MLTFVWSVCSIRGCYVTYLYDECHIFIYSTFQIYDMVWFLKIWVELCFCFISIGIAFMHIGFCFALSAMWWYACWSENYHQGSPQPKIKRWCCSILQDVILRIPTIKEISYLQRIKLLTPFFHLILEIIGFIFHLSWFTMRKSAFCK